MSGVPVQGRPGQVRFTRGVHPQHKGHHCGHSQGRGCRQLRPAGGRDRDRQPEPQSHLWYADYLQGANPLHPAKTGLTQTAPGWQGTCELEPAESRYDRVEFIFWMLLREVTQCSKSDKKAGYTRHPLSSFKNTEIDGWLSSAGCLFSTFKHQQKIVVVTEF